MTSMMHRLQKHNNIDNAVAIDCGNEHGLVLHGLFLKQNKSVKEPVGASLNGSFS
ncbi:hypothetical protein [Phosphitispora fastidiosa]|uniref:hypothetical protein n=1 Tax=Phosphitispora fastidiosa TaxID=2837202 RepID=UPI001E627E9A|nr:hypothetical protein [Phosphitispora fastidiosa]MBU7006899.1 hypothetical protein [Phosphitispora fastidiosa]